MNCNVGGTDRTVRYSLGSAALALALFGKMSRGKRIAALALAGSEFFTATTRYCPLNKMMGINTCEPGERVVENIQSLAAEPVKELSGTGI